MGTSERMPDEREDGTGAVSRDPSRDPRDASKDASPRRAERLQPADFVFVAEPVGSRVVLAAAVDAVAAAHGLKATLAIDALSRREQAGSTALGHGFAIPHARIDGIVAPLTIYVRAAPAIPFGAADGEPVSHFLVVLVPRDGDSQAHLDLLAEVAHLLSDRRFRRRLDGAATASAAADAFRAAIERLRP